MIAACTFIIGVLAATVWLIQPASKPPVTQPASISPDKPAPQATPDATIYTVKFCDLVQGSNRYDNKLVRIQAIYEQGVDTSALTGPSCDGWIRDTCSASGETCGKIYDRIWAVINSSKSYRVKVEVIGRYHASAKDVGITQPPGFVHLLEITELKNAKPVTLKERTRR